MIWQPPWLPRTSLRLQRRETSLSLKRSPSYDDHRLASQCEQVIVQIATGQRGMEIGPSWNA